MKRHYYISDDMDELKQIEQELEAGGLTTPQIHVLSENDLEVEKHHLNEVEAVLKKDVVHSMGIGALIGLLLAVMILSAAYLTGITVTTGWLPFAFLSVLVLGFCTWEGGLFGIQIPHNDFQRFQEILQRGRHVLFVDVEGRDESLLSRVMRRHPRLEIAGTGQSTPAFVVGAQNKFKSFIRSMP